jgi:cadmium resistance protein CadD (predicted permease)
MDKLIYISTYLANIALILIACVFFTESYGSDRYLAFLLFIPPCLSLWSLYTGPDLEERKLRKQLNKAKMQKELEGLK